MMRIFISITAILICNSFAAFAQTHNWPFQAPATGNVDIGDFAHLSVAKNPLNNNELIAIARSDSGNFKAPYKNLTNSTHLNTYHSFDGGMTWSHNVDSGMVAKNYLPRLTVPKDSNLYYQTPAIAFRLSGSQAYVVAAYQATRAGLNGIYFTKSNLRYKTTNPIDSDWTSTTIEENYQTDSTRPIPIVYSPSMAVDNNASSAHKGRAYILYNQLPALPEAGDTIRLCGGRNNDSMDYRHITLHLAHIDTTGSPVVRAIPSCITPSLSLLNRQLQAGSISVGPDGTVFITFLQDSDYDWCDNYYGDASHFPPDHGINFTQSFRTNTCTLHVAYSTDGGDNFTDVNLGADSIVHQLGIWDASSGSLASAYFHANAGEYFNTAGGDFYNDTSSPSIPVSSAPYIAVGNSVNVPGSPANKEYGVYVTWADAAYSQHCWTEKNPSNNVYFRKVPYLSGTSSAIKLLKLDFGKMDNDTVSKRGPLGSQGVKTIKDSVVDPPGDLDTVDDKQQQRLLFGPSVAIDNAERICPAYYSTLISHIQLNAMTGVNVAYKVSFSASPGYRRVSNVSGSAYQKWGTGLSQGSNAFYSRAFVFADIGDGTTCYPAGATAVWVQGMQQKDTAHLKTDTPKEIYSQFLPSATTANWGALHLDSAQTGPANGRKIVFDGDRYHCVYFKQDPGTPVKYSVYYTY